VTRRLSLAAAALVTVCFAAPAAAQSARAQGFVRDVNGRPVRSAIVHAHNDNGHPSDIQSATDDKGRWAMIGLSTGEWRFTVEAPGYVAASASVPVRVAASPPLTFTLAHDLGPVPGALDKNIQQEIADANALRDQGRLDQAIAAYDTIRANNPKLISIHLVLAEAYRARAAQEGTASARDALLNRALASYGEVLKADATNERAQAGLSATRAALAGAVPLTP
jgi:tetratricopeptide (TPR) repeat protein